MKTTNRLVRSTWYVVRGIRHMNYGFALLILSLVIGTTLRFYRLGEIPVSLYWDEAAIGYDAYALNQWGKDMHGNSGFQAIFPSYGDYKLPVYIWLASVSEHVFGPTPFAIRLPSAIAGIGIILVAYLLSLELFSTSLIAGFSAFFAAILPVDILFSRTGFEGHVATLFVGITLWLWLKSRKQSWLLFFSSVTGALAVYSYFSARVAIPLMAVCTFFFLWKQTTRRWKLYSIACLGVWAVLLFPIYLSPYYKASDQFRMSTVNLMQIGPFALESNVLREQSGNSLISRILYHRYLLQAKAVLINIASHLDINYLFMTGDHNLRHSTGTVGIMFWGTLPLYLIGILFLGRHQLPTLLWLMGLWIAFVLPAAIPIEVPHALRSLNTVLLCPMVLAQGMHYVWKLRYRFIRWSILFVIVIEIGILIHDYTAHYPQRSAVAWQSGYSEVADYLLAREALFDSCTINYPDDRLYLYFLLRQHISPTITAAVSNRFMIPAFGKYRFGSVRELPTLPRSCIAVDYATWVSLGQPRAEIISNTAGNALFYIVITGE